MNTPWFPVIFLALSKEIASSIAHRAHSMWMWQAGELSPCHRRTGHWRVVGTRYHIVLQSLHSIPGISAVINIVTLPKRQKLSGKFRAKFKLKSI